MSSEMPTLDQPPQFPPDLQHENPPSVPNLIAQIDPWVIYHLKTTILSDVHYENQLYGVLNLFHASIYPLRRRFMTIPQGLLRKVLDPDNIDEYLADLSFGSTGGLHESRDLRKSHSGWLSVALIHILIYPFDMPSWLRSSQICPGFSHREGYTTSIRPS